MRFFASLVLFVTLIVPQLATAAEVVEVPSEGVLVIWCETPEGVRTTKKFKKDLDRIDFEEASASCPKGQEVGWEHIPPDKPKSPPSDDSEEGEEVDQDDDEKNVVKKIKKETHVHNHYSEGFNLNLGAGFEGGSLPFSVTGSLLPEFRLGTSNWSWMFGGRAGTTLGSVNTFVWGLSSGFRWNPAGILDGSLVVGSIHDERFRDESLQGLAHATLEVGVKPLDWLRVSALVGTGVEFEGAPDGSFNGLGWRLGGTINLVLPPKKNK